MSFVKERLGQISGAQGLACAAVGDHGPLTGSVHQYKHLARLQRRIVDQVRMYPGLLKLSGQGATEDVVPDPADEVRLGTNGAEPGSGVRARATRSCVDGCEGVGPES